MSIEKTLGLSTLFSGLYGTNQEQSSDINTPVSCMISNHTCIIETKKYIPKF